MENAKKEITTAELVGMVKRGEEARRLGQVKTTAALGPCDVAFILPPAGMLEHKLAACKAGGTKKVAALAERLRGKKPDEVQAIFAEYQYELANSEEETRLAENEVYADYIADIRDRDISPAGKSYIKLSFLGDSAYMDGYSEYTDDSVIEYCREVALLLLKEDRVRNWLVHRITNVVFYNALRKESELGNSGPSRDGAPVESQPAPNAPNGNLSDSARRENPSSTCISTKPKNSSTNGEGNS